MRFNRAQRRATAFMAPFAALILTGLLLHEPLAHKLRVGPASAAAAVAEHTVTIRFSGDVLVHPRTWQQAHKDAGEDGGYNFRPIFYGIRDAVSGADLSICHLEAPAGPGKPADFPKFRAPVEVTQEIRRVGYDACSTASNHSLDQGERGVYDNLDALDAAGLAHTGTFRSAKAQATPTIYTTDSGVKIGHLSFAYGLNPGTSRPVGKEWLANVTDPAVILAAAKRTRAAGAQIVVLSMHWGAEGSHRPGPQQIALAQKLTASPDVDLIIGHHTHVVQPAQKINGKWVYYGVGNTLASHDFPNKDNRSGIVGSVKFTPGANGRYTVNDGDAAALPIWQSVTPVRVIDLSEAIASMSDADSRRRKYVRAFNAIRGHVGALGAFEQGMLDLRPPV